MTKGNSALKAGLGYTIGNILVKGINFLALPLLSRILTTENFGVYNVFLSYEIILSVLIGLALHSSVKSANYEFKRIDEYVSSISLIYVLNACLYLLVFLICGKWLSRLMGFKETVLLLLIPFSFGGAILQLYNERISLDYAYKKYLIIALLNSLGNVIVSLTLIFTVFNSQRDIGYIMGTSATIIAIALVLLWKMYGRSKPRINKIFWKYGIMYSLPIVPHGISQVLLAQCDRIMISNMVSNSAAGIYSLAGNLKLILNVVSTSIAISWSTWFFSKMENGRTDEIQKNAGMLVRIFLIFTVGMMALSPEIIYVLGGAEYDAGKYVAIPMIMDAFLLFIYNVVVPSEYYTKNTKYIMYGTLIAAVINLILNYIFIKKYGFIAAAYTTLFSYVCYLVIHIIISRKVISFDIIRIKEVLLSSLVMMVMGAFVIYFVNNILTRYIFCVVIVIALCPPLLKRFAEIRNNQEV